MDDDRGCGDTVGVHKVCTDRRRAARLGRAGGGLAAGGEWQAGRGRGRGRGRGMAVSTRNICTVHASLSRHLVIGTATATNGRHGHAGELPGTTGLGRLPLAGKYGDAAGAMSDDFGPPSPPRGPRGLNATTGGCCVAAAAALLGRVWYGVYCGIIRTAHARWSAVRIADSTRLAGGRTARTSLARGTVRSMHGRRVPGLL